MDVLIDYTDILKNILSAFFYGLSLSAIYKIFKIMDKTNNTKNIYKKNSRLILKKKQILSREEIVKIGREAIRCHKTNAIMNEPVIGVDGFSYNKLSKENQNPSEKLYENRSLKQFIEKLKNRY